MSIFNVLAFDAVKQRRTAVAIGEKLDMIKNSNQLIFSKLIPQLDAHWSGEAKQGFVRRYIEIQGDLDILVKSYEELHSNLLEVSKNYGKAEEQAVVQTRTLK